MPDLDQHKPAETANKTLLEWLKTDDMAFGAIQSGLAESYHR